MSEVGRVTRRPRHSGDLRSEWSSLLPSVFVIAALLALLVAPLTVESRVDALSEEIDQLAEPARDLLIELRYVLARQSSSLRGYLITEDRAYLERYEEFVAREEEIHPQLAALADQLGGEAVSHVREVERLSTEWRALISAAAPPDPSASADLQTVVLEQEAYTAMLDAAALADLAIRGEILARTQEIRGVERMSRAIYSLLVLLALGAALAVALLNLRIRRLAAAANERNAEIEEALDETARAVEARSYLIRGFTHDVKNPLGAADGFAELLEAGIRGKLSPEQTETIRRIRRSIRSALEIIDELLDLSRLESGGLRTDRVEVDLDALIGESVRQHAAAATSGGIELTFEPSEVEGGVNVFTDPDRVTQIAGNLISNALKYTPAPGRVTVRVRATADGGAPQPGRWLVVSVVDTGPGIPPAEIERIFDEFHRVPGAPGKGHGLGLAISRGVARLLGGDVTVRSTVGEGSEFMLWLPVRDSEPAPDPPPIV